MTNIHRIKRPPAAVVLAAAVAPTLRPPAVDVSIYPDPARVSFVAPGYLASVNAWIHPDRQPDNATPAVRIDAARLARHAAAVQNGPKRPNAAPWPNGLNGLNTPERPERPERLKVTRTNDLNELNELNDLKQAHRYPGGVFKPERLERLN